MQNKSIILLIRQRVFKSPRAMQMELFLNYYFTELLKYFDINFVIL